MGNLLSSLCRTKEESAHAKGGGPIPPIEGETEEDQVRKISEDSTSNSELTIERFTLIKVIQFYKYLGIGAFGRVVLARKNDNKKLFAIKVLKKKDFKLTTSIQHVMVEREILMKSEHPFIVKLRYAFQDDTRLYYCIDYVAGGDLFTYLQKMKKFNLETARFYAVEILLALEYLHEELNTIYRDLKPENVLIDASGHIKLTDFGLSKSKTR